jgi:hypothetical protein
MRAHAGALSGRQSLLRVRRARGGSVVYCFMPVRLTMSAIFAR